MKEISAKATFVSNGNRREAGERITFLTFPATKG